MQIIINGIPTQLGGALPSEITSCEINADPLTLAHFVDDTHPSMYTTSVTLTSSTNSQQIYSLSVMTAIPPYMTA